MIPKIIHYCWLSNDPLPNDFKVYLEGWHKKMPEYKFILWDFNRFDINSSKWVKDAFEQKKYAFAADYIRLFALFNYGGIYLDLDVEVVKSLDDLLDRKFILGYESSNKAIEGGIIGGKAKDDWLNDCLEYYKNRSFIKDDGSFDTKPLPYILHQIISNKYPQYLNDILPFDYLTAKSLSTRKIEVTSNTYTIHHFAGSWTPLKSRIKRRLKDLLGSKITSCIVKLKQKVNG